MKTYKIISAESEFDEDGPHEVFLGAYLDLDRTDFKAVEDRAASLTKNYDGTYVVREDV